jgi:hypothetical protein
MDRMLIWGAFVSLVTFACVWRPRTMRVFVGVFFVVMALGVDGSTILGDLSSYATFASGALLPIYRDVALAVVQVSPVLIGVLMLVFELVVAGLILGRGRAVRLGLLGGIVFLLGITPLGIEELPNPILAVGLGYLATQQIPVSVPGAVQGWVRARGARPLAERAAP